ncbi:melatonin receptor type 1B-A [Tachysurus ichikawai]
MPEDDALIRNRTEAVQGRAWGAEVAAGGTRPGPAPGPTWQVAVLASVLIFTSVVDVLGNALVIVSVLRNRKLRNAVYNDFHPRAQATTTAHCFSLS